VSGGLRFHSSSDLIEGVHAGRLYVDAHSEDHEQVLSGGTVTAIELVPIRYTIGESNGQSMYLPTAQLTPLKVESTAARADLDDRLPFGDSMVQAELLVWINVEWSAT
jgi:hypothetical protein